MIQHCFGETDSSAGASAADPVLTAVEVDDSSYTPSSEPAMVGNRVQIQSLDISGGWSGPVPATTVSADVYGIVTTSGELSRNLISISTEGTAWGVYGTDTITGHSNLVEILGTDDAVGIELDGEDCLLVGSTVVLDGAGYGIWTTGSNLVGLVNNLVQTAEGGTCFVDDSSTRDYMLNNLVWGCTDQLYEDSAGYRTLATELNFITVTTSAGGHVYDDPLFTDEAGSDHSLQSGSPAIDVGQDVSSSTFGEVAWDLVGNACSVGSNYDIGAYEQ